MSRCARFAIALTLVALCAAHAAPAAAAPSAWTFIDVGLQVEQGQSLLLVSGELPEDTPLPAEAELAVPAGTQLLWIGEILGGPPAQDPELQYVKTTNGDMDIYSFTLTTSRTAQIEGTVTGMSGASGENLTSNLRWTAWRDVPSVRMAHRLPLGSAVVEASEGASLQAGDEDFSYYSKTVADVKAGDVLDLTFAYTLPAVAPGSAGDTTGSMTFVILAGIVLVVAVFMFLALRRKALPATAEVLPQDAPTHASRPGRQSMPPELEPVLEPESRTGRTHKAKLLMLGAISAVIVLAFVVLSGNGSVKDGKITKFFGSTSPCASMSLVLIPNQGVDLAKQGADIVDAFAGFDSIGDVTLTIDTATLDVTYCESSQNEASIRQIVEGTGLVVLAPAP